VRVAEVGLEVHLIFLVVQLLVAGRRTAFHGAEVLAPACPPRVLLKPLLLSSSETRDET
jgi:hypothetical protein